MLEGNKREQGHESTWFCSMALMVQWGRATSIYSIGAPAVSVKRCRNSYGSPPSGIGIVRGAPPLALGG